MQEKMKQFLDTPTRVEELDGHKITVSLNLEFWADAIVEDPEGNKAMVNVEHRNWTDYHDFLRVILDEYKKGQE